MLGKGVELKPDLPSVQKQGSEDRALRKTCKEFESVFTYQLLRSMRRTVEKCDLFHGGSGEEVYESLLDQELAKSMSSASDRGLADLLYQQLRSKGAGSKEGPQPPPGPLDHGAPRWPVQGSISSEFGWRTHPIHGDRRFHQGLDVAAEQGTPIACSLPGRVVTSEFQEGYGNLVVVDHGRGISTLYAHNRKNLVRTGDWVQAGDPVAQVGSTGMSTGPHLHFEVRRHGRALNPARFLGTGPGKNMAETDLEHLSQSPVRPI